MLNYSIIIPHKNCPDLLKRLLDSIPERDDVQIIVVDDNSDEGKKPSIDRKDTEVILLDAERSKGAGRARNVGLEHAKGKWLLFADADDYYTDKLPMLLDKYAGDESTDIVYLNACMFDEGGNEKPHKTDGLIRNYLNGLKGAENNLRYNLWTPWSRMVKHQLVRENKVRFDELPACNDKMFCLYCSHYARNISAEDVVLYKYYRPRQGSQTDSKRNLSMLDDLLDVRCRTISLYKKAGYKPIPSVLELLYNSKYSIGLSKRQLIRKYRETLSKAKVPLVIDLSRYFSISNRRNR